MFVIYDRTVDKYLGIGGSFYSPNWYTDLQKARTFNATGPARSALNWAAPYRSDDDYTPEHEYEILPVSLHLNSLNQN